MKTVLPRIYVWYLLAGFLVLIIPGCGDKKEEVDSGSVPYHIGMGKAFYQLGKYEKAIEMYRKAVALDARSEDAYLQLAIIYDDNLQNKEQAIACYQKFLELAPDSEKAKWVRDWMDKSRENLERPPVREEPETGAEAVVPVGAPSPASARMVMKPEKIPSPAPLREAEKTVSETSTPPASYTVKSGDTLVQIAHRVYGDRNAWSRIYQANQNILSSPHALQPGQKLKIPPKRSTAVIEM